MTKAPSGGGATGSNPTDRGKSGTKSRELVVEYGYTAYIRSRGEEITKKAEYSRIGS